MSARERADKDSERFDEWIRHANESGEEPAIPAATVVVLRDTDEGLQTLMLKKKKFQLLRLISVLNFLKKI